MLPNPETPTANINLFTNIGTPECAIDPLKLTPDLRDNLDNPSIMTANAVYIATQRLNSPNGLADKRYPERYSKNLQELLAAAEYEDGLYFYNFQDRQGGKGLAAEGIFLTVMKSLNDPNISVRVADANADNQGVDFEVSIGGHDYDIDVSSSAGKGMMAKIGDPDHVVVFIPIEPGNVIRYIPHDIDSSNKNIMHKKAEGMEAGWYTKAGLIVPHKMGTNDLKAELYMKHLSQMHSEQGGVLAMLQSKLSQTDTLKKSFEYHTAMEKAVWEGVY